MRSFGESWQRNMSVPACASEWVRISEEDMELLQLYRFFFFLI